MFKSFASISSAAICLTLVGVVAAGAQPPPPQQSPSPRPPEQSGQQQKGEPARGNPQQRGQQERAGQPTWGTMISSMNNASAETTELSGLKNLTAANVHIVNVSELAKGNSMEAFNNALKRNDADITKMRTALNSNPTIAGVLKAKNIASNRVVGVDVQGNMVYVFVQPNTP